MIRRYAPMKPSRACRHCRQQFAPTDRGQTFCSKACGYEARKARTRRPRPCPVCGTSFQPYPSALLRRGGKFCSVTCYRAQAATRPAMVTSACTNCAATFQRTAAAIKRTARSFCSNACRSAFMRGAMSPVWRGGSDPNRGRGWLAIAEQARVRDGRLCRWCGKSEADNGQRLSVDHILPWRSFQSETEANDPANLASLCRSCHSRKSGAERRWLLGDVLAMRRYQEAVTRPHLEGVTR